ncbi:hypothetical protein JCM17380_44820 [Desulfosporosinus burensis]
MPGHINWIRLSQIFLDPLFGCEEDTRLTADIRKNKLDNPLIVEGPINDHYILVDGYKRYISLVHLGWESVQCTIEPVSDRAYRIAKRLRRDYNKQKMRSSERIRYVHWLLGLQWDINTISKETGIARAVVRKYEKIRDIPQEYKDIIKSLKLGHEALLALDRMQSRVPSRTFYQIVDVLKRNSSEIFGYHVGAIEYLTKVAEFSRLPETAVKRAVRKTIINNTFRQKEAKKIVDIEAVVSGITQDDSLIEQCMDFIIKEASELANIVSPNLMKNATPLQRKQIVAVFEKCLEKARSNTNWWDWSRR